ncbi:hypothetical protein B0H14DRAFT_3869262 [Mycena olivaceomarginata]|nr:hypothetical protein B0H14DRAFT_3869262 [Mycena olivaceomarginata]
MPKLMMVLALSVVVVPPRHSVLLPAFINSSSLLLDPSSSWRAARLHPPKQATSRPSLASASIAHPSRPPTAPFPPPSLVATAFSPLPLGAVHLALLPSFLFRTRSTRLSHHKAAETRIGIDPPHDAPRHRTGTGRGRVVLVRRAMSRTRTRADDIVLVRRAVNGGTRTRAVSVSAQRRAGDEIRWGAM